MTVKVVKPPPEYSLGSRATEFLREGLFCFESDVANWNDGATVPVFQVPANFLVVEVKAEIIVAFDGATPAPTIALGDSGDVDRLFTTADLGVAVAKKSTINGAAASAIFHEYTAATTINLTQTAGGAQAAGQVKFWLIGRFKSHLQER